MATTILTEFESIHLSSHLPEEVDIETDASSLEVSIYLNNMLAFRSVYYPFLQVVTIRDIRSIVEYDMLNRKLTLTTLKIVAKEPITYTQETMYDEYGNIHISFDDPEVEAISDTVENIKVIYCNMKTNMDSESFLSNNFLTTRKSMLLHRTGKLKLYNHTKGNARSDNYALIYYSLNGNTDDISVINFNYNSVQSTIEDIVLIYLSHQTFKQIVDNRYDVNCIIRGVEYHIGNRIFNIYFTDEEPTDEFVFLNAFNLQERFYLYGATTVKTEADHSEAVCGRQSQYYDESVKVKHEVETAPMSYEEAKWINQMLTSKLVQRPVGNNEYVQVLISDITSEVSNSDKDLIRIKFSWKYAEGVEWI